jgi:hypothetical protein
MVGRAPFYIIGTERSGSNLLRVILNAHSNIAIPHPPHIMRYFASLAPGYGDLSDPKNLRSLTDDVLRLIETHIYPWEVALDAGQIVAEARPKSLLGVFGAIQDQHRSSTKKARWGCKSTFMVRHIDEALARDPGAKFIWLVRDPRDVAVSARMSVFAPFHPMHTAALWADEQAEVQRLESRLGSSIHRLRYEDLLADPRSQIEQVCDFLGELFEPELLNYAQTTAAQKGAKLSRSWENTGRPLLRNNSGKYKTHLTVAELASVEAVAGDLMDALGYTREIDPPCAAPSAVAQARFACQGLGWQLGVELRSLREDKNHWRRWRRAALMGWLGLLHGHHS